MRGRFIVLEGIDGSGTTTQARRLAEALTAQGQRVCLTAEPSTGAIGRLIREQLGATAEARPDRRALALLFAADRLDHVAREIEPALARGETVICDRYVVSSWAYQSLDCPRDWVETINRHAPWPELTLWLDIDVVEAQARIARRHAAEGTPTELFDAPPLQRRVAAAYRQILEETPGPGIVRIDAARSADEVATAALAALAAGAAPLPAP
jgi:dTMP kinase